MRNALGGARIARIRPAPTRIAVGTLAVVLAMALGGCVASDPVVTPPPPASSAPLFATDADALRAAEEAYAAYLKVSDQILADGGANPERIDAVTTAKMSKREMTGFKSFLSRGYRSIGQTTMDRVTLQSYSSEAKDGTAIVSIYVCQDLSAVDVIDQSGISVVSSSRPSRTPFEAKFSMVSTSSILRLSSNEVWDEMSYCQ